MLKKKSERKNFHSANSAFIWSHEVAHEMPTGGETTRVAKKPRTAAGPEAAWWCTYKDEMGEREFAERVILQRQMDELGAQLTRHTWHRATAWVVGLPKLRRFVDAAQAVVDTLPPTNDKDEVIVIDD